MTELSQDQQRALDQSPEIPARVIDSVTHKNQVLLRADDFAWIQQLLQDEPDVPQRLDPRSGVPYALLPEERYERFRAFFEEDPLTLAERSALLREAGRRAGWNDPVWHSSGEP